MKHFIQYVDTTTEGDGTAVRLLEINDVPQKNQRATSLMGIAATEGCKQMILKMSRLHREFTFSWGHQEEDGRTWLHGYALDGVYRDGDGREVNVRRVDVHYVDGRSECLRSSRDPFEFDLTDQRWTNVSP